MAYEYLIIEVILTLVSIFYLYYTPRFKPEQFKRVALLSLLGFVLFLIEIPFHYNGTWRFSTEIVSNILILTMPIEELLFYIIVFPLVATSLWVFSEHVEEWFK